MQTVFINPTLQAQFEEEGLVTLDLMSPEEVKELNDFYQSLSHGNPEGFHCSMFNSDKEYRIKVDEKIRQMLKGKFDKILLSYYPLYANYMVKEPGESSEMKLHQDWAYVDESKYISLAVWFPLIDLDHDNGCLYFVKGSHKLPTPYRGPGVMEPYRDVSGLIMDEYLTPVPLKAGQAVIWHHRMLHWSPPNMGKVSRIAPTAIFVPESVTVQHHYRDNSWLENEVEVFEVDNSFYMNYTIAQKPNGVKSLGLHIHDMKYFTEADIQFIRPEKPSKGILGKIMSMFGN